MNSTSIRQKFLEFFQSKAHEVVSSAPMVIKNDPTLMFTNAGMNQFKDLFLGNSAVKFPRISNSQKCLRVSGKHNDLEEVGVDTYHHTMFEMLGNWSFGDYFKKEAINWAWELLTEVYGIDKDRLYVTIFEGDKEDGLDEDQEALELWKAILPEDRILKCDKKDNFWEMGETGPCGPCSEIHVDVRPEEDRAKVDGKTLVNQDHPQVVEVWNLVFMQYNRMADKSLVPLPAKHVDTGMGFERLAMVLQGKQSNYDTDVFQGMIQSIAKKANVAYEQSDSKRDIAIRVISDHIRAIAFSIADGQLPSNTGAGYVIRRILRRAVRYGYSFLNFQSPFMFELVDLLEGQMGEAFPELKQQKELIKKVIKEEEESFLRTLERGILRMEEVMKNCQGKVIAGDQAFELYDTYGFPLDLTELIASEKEFTVDLKGFEKALEQQKNRSREATKVDTDDWVHTSAETGAETTFVGYDQLESDTQITQYRKVSTKKGEFFQLVLSTTPFYPEGGGQVGDTGYLEDTKGNKTSVIDTKKENNQILHVVKALPETVEGTFKAVVGASKRKASEANHSATHLLHGALRKVLGTHVEQKGSLVNSDYLRFDFSHFSKVTEEELQQVETLVNQEIRASRVLNEKRKVPYQEGVDMGAIALFGEKYGDEVRVIQFGDSIEFCGGTHVQNTALIGQVKITTETAVASGVRRIEAISAERADAHVQEELNTLKEVRELLKNPKDLAKTVQGLQEDNKKLQKEIEQLMRLKAQAVKQELKAEIQDKAGVNFLAKEVDLDPGSIKDLAFQLKAEVQDLFLVLGTTAKGKPNISVLVSDSLVEAKELHAGNIVRELAKEIQGGGGGQPFFATAGGKNPDGLENALKKAEGYLV